jgi:hypothetical protein
MPVGVNAYIPLATVTLGSSASSVTFSSIPATYRDLVLVINATASNNINVDVRFNGDTGSNYPEVFMAGDGTTTYSIATTRTFLRLDYVGFIGTVAGHNNIIQIMDYSATDKHKTVLARGSNANNGVAATAGRWANTAAITSIQAFAGFPYSAGSTFNLYGIAS